MCRLVSTEHKSTGTHEEVVNICSGNSLATYSKSPSGNTQHAYSQSLSVNSMGVNLIIDTKIIIALLAIFNMQVHFMSNTRNVFWRLSRIVPNCLYTIK